MLTLTVLFVMLNVANTLILLILNIHVKQPFSGRFASAHLHSGTTNAHPKPKHPPPKKN